MTYDGIPKGRRCIDRDGYAWEQRADGWHRASCPNDCPVRGRSRADIEALLGPLTEVTA